MLTKFDPACLEGLTQEERDKCHGFDLDWAALGREGAGVFTRTHAMLSKWSGVYKQLQPGFFMMRTRVPGGRLRAGQAHVMAELAARYAQDQLCITTRQCLQYHWITLPDIAAIMHTLAQHGLTGKNACGDVTRNICCCTWSGVCPHEQADARTAADAVERVMLQRDDLRNLPRKFKMNFCGCAAACGQPFTNDLGWIGVRAAGAPGFALFAAGGLGARPFLATPICDFVPPDLVVPVTCAAITLFRDWGNRRNRAYARSKYVMQALGRRRYQELLSEYLAAAGADAGTRARLRFSSTDDLPAVPALFDRSQAVVAQAQPGKVLLQVLVARGELTAAQLHGLTELATAHGDDQVYFTHRQNVELHGLDATAVAHVRQRVHALGLRTDGFGGVPDTVACVGTTFCNLAVANTPNTYRLLTERIAAHPDPQVRACRVLINLNGCPNACGQHKIADIGLRGMRLPAAGGSVEAFEVSLGGNIYDGTPALNAPVACIPASECPRAIALLLETFVAQRANDRQPFCEFYRSHSRDFFVELLRACSGAPTRGALAALLHAPRVAPPPLA
jgi:sulfite reductase beta subunit-like hemoprotein